MAAAAQSGGTADCASRNLSVETHVWNTSKDGHRVAGSQYRAADDMAASAAAARREKEQQQF